MKTIYLQAFSLIKYNLVLFFPFLLFLLIMGLILIPLGSAGGSLSLFYIFFIFISLMAVFLSGWLNMFKKCVYSTVNENLTAEQRTLDSLSLYKEFFPGVGKYFTKIALGLLIYFFLFNFLIFILKMLLISSPETFESFTQKELINFDF